MDAWCACMDAWDDAWDPTHLGGRQVEEDEHAARSKGVVHVQKPNGESSDGTCFRGLEHHQGGDLKVDAHRVSALSNGKAGIGSCKGAQRRWQLPDLLTVP